MVKIQPKPSLRRWNWRWLVALALLVAAVYIVMRNADVFAHSLRALGSASPVLVLLAVCLTLTMFVAAAGMFQLLALKPLRLRQTALIEFAAAGVNRLLPGGVGGLGVHGLYLYRKKHTPAQATAVVGTNNLLGIGMHLLLLSLLFVIHPGTLAEFTLPHLGAKHLAAACFVLAALLLVGMVPRWRTAIASFLMNVLKSLRFYRAHPNKLGWAAMLAVTVSALYTSILFVLVHSLGLSIGFLPAFIIFSLGVLTATATPTPGGLVGAEAGLFLGFTAYGFTAAQALSATLLFRFITYWLPILPGLVCLALARRKHLL